MSGLAVFLLSLGLLAGISLSYLILGAASDARADDARRRRQHAIDAFAAVLFAENPDRLASVRVRHRVERETLVEVVSALPVQLGEEGRSRLRQILGAPRTARTFSRLARSKRWRTRVDAARLVGLMGSAEERDRLLDDRNWAVRAVAVAALSPAQVAEHADRVAQLLLDPDPTVRVAAADALPAGGVDIVMPLIAVLDQTARDRDFALLAAGRLTDRLLLGSLARHARSDHRRNRALAATALARQGLIEAEALLTEMLSDPEPSVRAIAAEGLGRIGSNRVYPVLRTLLSDQSWQVRRAAERSLTLAGPAGGMLVRQHRRRRVELQSSYGANREVPLPIGREERVRA
ncbi:MAG: HEAT repeat domain-containing protein [Acidimicrobiales bacterium]|nr:HEAT repeat domain-containing protein [Acidimicrobiales bacterium]